MKSVLKSDILDPDPLYRFKGPKVLADTPKGDSEPVVQLTVRKCDICAVGLQRETIIAVIHRPVVKRDVRRPDRVSPIGIC